MFSRRLVESPADTHCYHCPNATTSGQDYDVPAGKQQQAYAPSTFQQQQFAPAAYHQQQFAPTAFQQQQQQQQQQPAVGIPASGACSSTTFAPVPTIPLRHGGCQPPPLVPTCTTSASGVTSVFLTLGKQGEHIGFPDSYSLELVNKLSREEFSAIVAELNATAVRAHIQPTACTLFLILCPCTSICTAVSWKRKFNALKEDLHATCSAINARNAARGNQRVNLLYREVAFDGHNHPATVFTAQVEVQVV